MSKHDNRFINLKNNGYLQARNAADSADIDIIRLNASNIIELASIPVVGGQALLTAATGANNTLSNLGLTAINSNLNSGVTETLDLGSSTRLWRDLYVGSTNGVGIRMHLGAFETGRLGSNQTTPSGVVQTTALTNFWPNGGTELPVSVNTRNNSTNNTVATADLFLETGNKTIGTASSGSIQLRTGTATGTRGKIRLQDGSHGQANQVWTSSDANGSGSWRSIQTGVKNYLGIVNNNNLNGNFELGTTEGWTLSHSTIDPTTKVPNQASGSWTAASGNLSIAAVTSGNQLAGNYSLSLASSATTVAGDMLISNPFTIDKEDQAKPLTFQFYYQAAANATNGNFSGTSSSTFSVQVYDVTNNVWIQPTGTFGMNQSFGVGYCTGTFQTSSNSTQYRLAISVANATGAGLGGPITMYFDDFSLGPQTVSIGPAVTDWQSYTPNLIGANSVAYTNQATTGFYRRVGKNIEIQILTTFSGAPGSGTAFFRYTLPAGVVVDSSALPASLNSSFGSAISLTAGLYYIGTPFNDSSTTIAVAGQANGNYWGATQPNTFANGNTISIRASIPVVGWSSNVQMSSDTDTRVVAFKGASNPGQTFPSGASTQVSVSTVNINTHGTYASNAYTIPVSGIYNVQFLADFNSALTGLVVAQYKINGGSAISIGASTNLTQYTNVGSAQQLALNAGDVLTFFVQNSTAGTITLDSATINVSRLSGPSVIAASESVNARYTSTAGTSVSSTTSVIPFANKSFDSHNAWTSNNTFTCPISGIYCVSATITSVANVPVNSQLQVAVRKNGSGVYANLGNSRGAGVTAALIASGTTLVNCLAGETIQIIGYADTTVALDTSAQSNNVSILRVGN